MTRLILFAYYYVIAGVKLAGAWRLSGSWKRCRSIFPDFGWPWQIRRSRH